MSKKSYLLILFLGFNISFLTSCKKDDDSEEDTVPKRDLAEQYIAENDSIIEFYEDELEKGLINIKNLNFDKLDIYTNK